MTIPTGRPRHDGPRCGARKKQGEGTCTQTAGWGTDHPGVGACKLHGGKTPSHKVAAQVHAAEVAVRTYGLRLDVSPTDALLDEVQWTAGHVAWLRGEIQKLETEALAWGVTKVEDHGATEFPGTNTTESAAPPVLLDLYQRERRHLVDVCKAAIVAGIEERRVKLAEQQGALLAGVIQRILVDLALSPEQQARVSEVVPRHLRLVAESA
jgi:hypothetical protein